MVQAKLTLIWFNIIYKKSHNEKENKQNKKACKKKS